MTNHPRVTLYSFAAAVECHFTTASRLRSGTRMPGRELFNRIVKVYSLNPIEALDAFSKTPKEFGKYLRDNVFHISDEDLARDQEVNRERRTA